MAKSKKKNEVTLPKLDIAATNKMAMSALKSGGATQKDKDEVKRTFGGDRITPKDATALGKGPIAQKKQVTVSEKEADDYIKSSVRESAKVTPGAGVDYLKRMGTQYNLRDKYDTAGYDKLTEMSRSAHGQEKREINAARARNANPQQRAAMRKEMQAERDYFVKRYNEAEAERVKLTGPRITYNDGIKLREYTKISNENKSEADFYEAILAELDLMDKEDGYNEASENADIIFGRKGIENGGRREYVPTSLRDTQYDYINMYHSGEQEETDIKPEYTVMTPYERNILNSLPITDRETYLSAKSDILKKRYTEKKQAEAAEYAQEHPFAAGLKGTLQGVAMGIPAAVDNAVENITGDVDTYDFTGRAIRQADTYRSAGSQAMREKYGQAAGIAYDTGFTLLDVGLNILAGKGAGALLGKVGMVASKAASGIASANMSGRAAASAMTSIADRGGNDRQIITGGLASGLAEFIFEKYSLDKLLGTKSAVGVGNIIKSIAKQSAVEGSEELFTEAANIVCDAIIMQGQSESELRRRELMMNYGLSATEATAQSVHENVMRLATAGGMGALAGGIMGGGAVAAANASHAAYMKHAGERLTENPDIMNSVLAIGIKNNNAEAKHTAQMISGGMAIDSAEAGRMMESVLAESMEKDGGMVNIMRNITAIEGRGESYMGTDEAIDTAKAVMRMTQGKVTDAEREVLQRSRGAVTLLTAIEGHNKAWESVKKAAGEQLRVRSEEMQMRDETAEIGRSKPLPYGNVETEVYSQGERVKIPENSRIVKNVVLDEESMRVRRRDAQAYKNVEILAQDLGMRVKYVKGLTDGEGKALDGVITSQGIFINSDAENPSRFAATHEFSHRMKQAAPETWQRYQNFVTEKLQKDGRYENIFKGKAAAYNNSNADYINEEIAADYIGELFGNEAELTEFIKDSRRNAVTIRDIWYGILDKLGLLDEKKKAQLMWRNAYKAAVLNVEKGNVGEFDGKRFKYVGETDDGRKIYRTNYKEGTPKSVKQNELIQMIQNIWSKKPIRLAVKENGVYKEISANFNPELSERSDLSKIVFGNRKGNGSEKRMTLDLSADLYQIASDAKQTGSKAETGKENKAHDGVKHWYYFITNLVYENNNGEQIDCYMNIDVKENESGHYFYSFAIEKGTAPQTLLAVVSDEMSPTVPTDNSISNPKSIVNTYSMQNGENDAKKSVSGARISDIEAENAELKAKLEKTAAQVTKQKTLRSKDDIKRKIDSDYRYLYQMVNNPTDTRHVPEDMRGGVAYLLDCFKFETVQLDRIKAEGKESESPKAVRLEKMYEAYRDIIRKAWGIDNRNTENNLLDEHLSEDLKELRDMIPIDESGEFKRIQDMSVEELRSISKVLTAVHHSITQRNKTFNSAIKEEISELGVNTVLDMQSIRNKRKGSGERLDYDGIIKGIDKYLNFDNVQPWDFFHGIGGTMERLYMEERKAFNRHIENIREASEVLQSAAKGLNLKKLTGNHVEKARFKLSNGEEILLTKGQILSLYALYQRKQGREHILGGGIVTNAEYKNERGHKASANSVHRVNEADMGQIFEALSEEEKRMVGEVVRFLSTRCAEWGNETSMKLYGYEKYGEGWYFPIKVSEQSLNTYYGEHGEGNLRSQSFTKKTVKHASNAAEIGDFFDIVTSHINGMSLYNTVALPMLDLERVLNFSHSAADNKVRQEIVTTFGKAAEEYIGTFHKDVNGSRKTTDKDKVIEKLSANAKKASIGLNARVLLQQPTSISRIFLFMDIKDIPAAWNLKALKKEMQENIPIAYWKSLGFRDIGTGSTMKEVLLDNESLYDKAAMGGYGAADDFTWSLIYAAVKKETARKNPSLDKNSAEFMEKVRERFDYVVDRSQVVDSVFHRTQIMRSGNAYTKTATMFMSEPLKTYNMYRTEMLDAVKNGEVGKKAARATAVFVVSNLLISIAQAIPDTWRENDEKELFKDGKEVALWKRFLKNIGENMIDNSNPLTYLPYIKDVWSMIQGFTQERIEYSGISDFFAALKGMKNDKKTLPARWVDLLKPASALFGLSYGNLYRDATALIRTVYTAYGDEYADYAVTKFRYDVKNEANKGKFMKYYKRAVENGHSEDAATILHDYMAETFEGQSFKNKHTEKVIGEMSKLYGKTDEDSKLLYDLPRDKFSVDGEEYTISESDYPKYVSGAYKILWDMAYEMVTSEGYKKLSDEDKVRSFGEIKDYAQEAQRMEIMDDYELSGWQEDVYSGRIDYIDNATIRARKRYVQEIKNAKIKAAKERAMKNR